MITFQPKDYFSTNLWTGNDGTQAITGVGFQPDFTWIKKRTGTTDHHLYDAIRGVTKAIMSNTSDAETTKSTGLTAFGSDGFTVGADGGVNAVGNGYVSWNWKAGTTTGLSGGTITPSAYSINTTSKVGIYKRTGTATAGTITHGLGGVPKMIISKNLTDASNWRVYHHALGNNKGINLNETARDYTDANLWNSTDPTSTVYSIGSSNDTNKSGSTFIDYVFCQVNGFSRFSNYVGSGATDTSPFIYTGFKPSMIIVKTSGDTEAWRMWDIKREGYNPTNDSLVPSTNDAEAAGGTPQGIDIFSNGFKLTSSNTEVNGNNYSYIYMAWSAEALVSSNDMPTTAR